MKITDEMVERAAKAAQHHVYSGAPKWELAAEWVRKQWRGVTRAALEAALTEDDWEYGYISKTAWKEDHHFRVTFLDGDATSEDHDRMRKYGYLIVRRRKAGPLEPVAP